MSSETDAESRRGDDADGYVHDPAAFDEADEPIDRTSESAQRTAGADREFDWRGWVLVGVMAFAFLVAPAAVFAGAHLELTGLSWWVALVIMPLLPALLLGATAVWATTRP